MEILGKMHLSETVKVRVKTVIGRKRLNNQEDGNRAAQNPKLLLNRLWQNIPASYLRLNAQLNSKLEPADCQDLNVLLMAHFARL